MSKNRLTSAERTKLEQFQQITNASDESSIDFLKKNSWNSEQALDAYFNNPPPSVGKQVDFEKIQSLFKKYADTEKDEINRGIEDLMQHLEIDAEDISIFIFAWKIRAKSLGVFTRTEFEEGLRRLRVDSIEGLKERLNHMKNEINDETNFKDFYQYLFDYARQPNSKTLPPDFAIVIWKIVLKNKFKHLNKWITFIQEKHQKAISKDTWNQVLEFTRVINDDMSNYDPTGAWPIVLDEFVEYLKNGN